MPAPVARYKILPARGSLAALTASIADIAEGEIAYAIDQDLYYQKQGGVLEPVGVPEAPQDGTQYVRNNAAWEAVDVPPGTVVGDTPPESPDQGQQWYDTGTARLFLWTGSEWVDASPDAESASFLVSETAPENANEGDGWFNESNGKTYVYVDGVWVQSTHTDMALLDGSVTPAKLSTGGPSWDASGNTTFAGGDIQFFDGGAAIYNGAINVYRDTGTSAGLIVGLNETNKTILRAEGSGSFASYINCNRFSPNQIFVGDSTNGKQYAFYSTAGDGSTVNVGLGLDGSASFTNSVDGYYFRSNEPNSAGGSSAAFLSQLNGVETSRIKAEGSALFTGANGTSHVFGIKRRNNTNSSLYSVSMDGNGNASFAGTVSTGTLNLSSTTTSGVEVRSSGEVIVQRPSASSTSAVLDVRLGSTQTVNILASGNASFGDYSTNGTTIFGSGSVAVNRNGPGSTCFYALLNGAEMVTISAGGLIKTGDTNTNGGMSLATDDLGSANQRGRQTFRAKAGTSGIQEILQAFTGTTEQLRITADGSIKNSTNSYTAISDGTLKENIVPALDQWDNIKNIEVVNFNFKEDLGYETHKQLGVIAQQVEEVSPGLVNTDEEGLKSVNYSVLYVKSVKALQEAMARIETLEAEVAALKQS